MSVNLTVLVGRLGQDPEIKYSPDGTAVANVSLATSKVWKDRSGERREDTQWHRLVFFGKLVEVVDKYLAKGSQIYVEGEIRYRKWDDKEGQTRYSTEIVCNKMQMLGGRSNNQGGGDGGYEQPRQQRQWQRPPADSLMDMDSDIPF